MSSPQPRPMPETVCWSRRSVVRWRFEVLVRMKMANSSLPGSGPRSASGPSSSGASTHHEALRCVPYSRIRIPIPSPSRPPLPSPKTNRATAPRGLVFFGGVSTSSRPAWERWRTMRFPSSKCQTRYLARRVTPWSVAPLRSAGRRGVGLQRREAEQIGPAQDLAGQQRIEALGERLHLGQFGHATMVA